MKEGTSLSNHLNEFNNIFSNLSLQEVEFEDLVKALFLLITLSESWDIFSTTIGNSSSSSGLTLANEACPFCRRVREALTKLDLTAEVYPCPKGSQHHRNFVRETGGKEQFPYPGISLYESGDIVKYLFKTYGGGRKPSKGLLESTILTGWVPTLLRAGRGMSRWQAAIPEIPPKKLELFSYENNQFARIVREALCELELPYVLRNVGLGSTGSSQVQVPLLVDPNTGVRVENHEQILQYLFKNYSSQKIVANV
ncbi:hypothetical protein L7F22_004973 [Adiantum nelumboides]|nr:hypothetical protein [Adiantum nelumboides]